MPGAAARAAAHRSCKPTRLNTSKWMGDNPPFNITLPELPGASLQEAAMEREHALAEKFKLLENLTKSTV